MLIANNESRSVCNWRWRRNRNDRKLYTRRDHVLSLRNNLPNKALQQLGAFFLRWYWFLSPFDESPPPYPPHVPVKWALLLNSRFSQKATGCNRSNICACKDVFELLECARANIRLSLSRHLAIPPVSPRQGPFYYLRIFALRLALFLRQRSPCHVHS